MLACEGSTRVRCVRIGGSDSERSAKEDRGAAIVDHDDPPQANAQLCFFLRKGIVLGHGIVVKTQLDGQPNEAANKAP